MGARALDLWAVRRYWRLERPKCANNPKRIRRECKIVVTGDCEDHQRKSREAIAKQNQSSVLDFAGLRGTGAPHVPHWISSNALHVSSATLDD